ncbi:SDR family oxidoreductase [Oceanobacillus massiliensis]|uniref:SDR family oxidoreductase n=1 Tax=Oceanobacillus massiliensis TaxID=1465765 RepID=UPI0002889FD9|nr:SDR family oxidoreductase [Oceanobacillus massiliensis]
MIIDLTPLKNSVIAITGASRGIGKATAEVLEKAGAKLVLGARSIDLLSSEFSGSENVLLIPLDVRDEHSVQEFVSQTVERFGRIDCLINAAGVGNFASILESDTADFDDMIAVNLRGTYLTCKYAGRKMKEQQAGQIINLVSIAGTVALPGNGAYSSSKFGVYGLTKVLQAELRREGIRTTAVLPGSIDNSFWDDKDFDLDKSNMIPQESIVEHIAYLLCQPKKRCSG